jgi:hypothetical protein
MSETSGICVLVGNEPRAYREAISAAVQTLRPSCRVVAVEPQDLDSHVAGYNPALVICSQLTEAVQALACWILLYPDGDRQVILSLGGQLQQAANIGLQGLLSLVDQVDGLAAAG